LHQLFSTADFWLLHSTSHTPNQVPIPKYISLRLRDWKGQRYESKGKLYSVISFSEFWVYRLVPEMGSTYLIELNYRGILQCFICSTRNE
jgi:hypothetical protein